MIKKPYNSIIHATLSQSFDKFTQTAELACSLAGCGELTLRQSSSVEFVPRFFKRVNRYKD